MKTRLSVIGVLAFCYVVSAGAAEKQSPKEVRVYEVNKYGQTQYHKGYLKVSKDAVVKVNKYGQTEHHKKSKIKD